MPSVSGSVTGVSGVVSCQSENGDGICQGHPCLGFTGQRTNGVSVSVWNTSLVIVRPIGINVDPFTPPGYHLIISPFPNRYILEEVTEVQCLY